MDSSLAASREKLIINQLPFLKPQPFQTLEKDFRDFFLRDKQNELAGKLARQQSHQRTPQLADGRVTSDLTLHERMRANTQAKYYADTITDHATLMIQKANKNINMKRN